VNDATREAHSPGALSLWLPPVLYLAAIWLASSQQAPTVLPPGGWDKLVHGLAYAGLGALLGRAFGGSGVSAPAALALAVLTASLYGASDEWHQSFVPNRFADARDWLADTLGACAGAVLWLSLRVLRARASIR
jgi:VanZ family protein